MLIQLGPRGWNLSSRQLLEETVKPKLNKSTTNSVSEVLILHLQFMRVTCKFQYNFWEWNVDFTTISESDMSISIQFLRVKCWFHYNFWEWHVNFNTISESDILISLQFLKVTSRFKCNLWKEKFTISSSKNSSSQEVALFWSYCVWNGVELFLRTNGWLEEWIVGGMDGWMNGRSDKWTVGQMDGRINGRSD